MIGTKFNKPLDDEAAYLEAASWCNENGAMIIDQVSYYEVVPVPVPGPEIRIVEIHARLTEIDLESVRPLRAIAAGEAVQADHDRLSALTSEASALREQLAILAMPQAET